MSTVLLGQAASTAPLSHPPQSQAQVNLNHCNHGVSCSSSAARSKNQKNHLGREGMGRSGQCAQDCPSADNGLFSTSATYLLDMCSLPHTQRMPNMIHLPNKVFSCAVLSFVQHRHRTSVAQHAAASQMRRDIRFNKSKGMSNLQEPLSSLRLLPN